MMGGAPVCTRDANKLEEQCGQKAIASDDKLEANL